MELDITHMMDESDEMFMLSGSVAELGEGAGKFTWNNSIQYGRENPILADETALDAAREYFGGFGAWSKEEIAAWSDADLQALACQEIAHNIREMDVADDYEHYQQLAEQGTVSGNIYKGDNGRWYFYMGS